MQVRHDAYVNQERTNGFGGNNGFNPFEQMFHDHVPTYWFLYYFLLVVPNYILVDPISFFNSIVCIRNFLIIKSI